MSKYLNYTTIFVYLDGTANKTITYESRNIYDVCGCNNMVQYMDSGMHSYITGSSDIQKNFTSGYNYNCGAPTWPYEYPCPSCNNTNVLIFRNPAPQNCIYTDYSIVHNNNHMDCCVVAPNEYDCCYNSTAEHCANKCTSNGFNPHNYFRNNCW
jgi:hypothetical protein